jgi:hypothetical protein
MRRAGETPEPAELQFLSLQAGSDHVGSGLFSPRGMSLAVTFSLK